MKLGTLISNGFQSTINKLSGENLPIKTAFKIKGLVKEISSEIEKYDELRLALIKKYGNKGEDGSLAKDEQGNASFTEENLQLFIKEHAELLSVDVNISKLSVDELGDIKLSAADLMNIEDVLS